MELKIGRNIFRFSLFVVVFVVLGHSFVKAQPGIVFRKIITSDNAFFDLSKKDFEDRVYALYGKWDFYWEKLLDPQALPRYENQKVRVDVPNTWTNYVINGEHLPSFGYATYHVRVKLPEDLNSVSISVHGVFTAYKIFINGKFIDENGKVGTDKKMHKGTWLPKTYVVYPEGDTLDIVLQVSNFVHFKAGLLRQIVVGEPQAMYRYSMLGIAYESSLIGAMLIMALYFLFFFYYQPQNISSLYLALVLIGQAILTSLDGEYVMFRFFPNLNFKFAMHLLYIFFYYRSILFLHYLYHLVPREINIKIVIFATSIYFIMTLYVIFFPIRTFEFALNFYIYATLILGVYVIISLFKLIKYQIGAVYTLIGLAIVLLTGINDALYDFGIIHTFYMLALGFSIFVFVLSMMIAMHNARAQGQIMAYWLMLKKLNTLREELIKIPFYDLSGALRIITTVINSGRGVWIDNTDKGLIVKYEHYLNKTNNINQPLEKLPDDFLNRFAVKVVLKFKRLFSYSLTKKDVRRGKRQKYTSSVSRYLLTKGISALAVSPVMTQDQLKSILYLENRYKPFSGIQKRLILSVNAQLAALKENADSYQQLQEINRKLEQLVKERTEILKKQEKQLQEKEHQLKEKIEELRAYNEQINKIHKELERHKYEIELRNFELEKLHNEIYNQKVLAEQRNRTLTKEIEFAKSIQQLILRVEPNLPFSDLFILYLPKQIVSGDFYWIRRFGKKIVIVVADCTGHGVPGAFMSVLGSTYLNELFNKYYLEDPLLSVQPSQILEELREMIIKSLGQETDNEDQVKDGMDISLVIYDESTQELKFSGAYLSLWIIRDKQVIELKGDRQPIGIYYRPNLSRSFTTHTFKVQKGDALYMFTDGYSDQFNPNGEKFYKKNLKKVLLEIAEYPGSIQRDFLYKIFQDWKGDHYQVDDILILGIII